MGKKLNAYSVWWGNLKDREHLEDLGIDDRLILKRFLKTRRECLELN
jgi:hypothetical protein